jgi:hypothetical protein
MNDIVSRIEQMSREEAFEAIGLIGAYIAPEASDESMAQQSLDQLLKQPYANIDELEQLARVTLIGAALTPEYEEVTRKAIEGAGQKNFILGGAEIVALSIVALAALHVIVTKGKASESETFAFEEKDGKLVAVSQKKEVKYGISSGLAAALKSVFGLPT